MLRRSLLSSLRGACAWLGPGGVLAAGGGALPAAGGAVPTATATAQAPRLLAPALHTSAFQLAGSTGKLKEPAGPRPEVLAYLRERGVDLSQRRLVRREEWGQLPPADVQQPDPALAHLTLPLARLLAELMAGREGLRLQSNSRTAGEYAARLVFLAREVGLPAEQIRQKYVLQPKNLMFSLASARSVLQWLLQWLSAAEVQRLAKNKPQTLTFRLDSLQANKQRLQHLFGLTDAQWAKAVSTAPSLLANTASTAQEMAAWLQREPARLSWAEVRRLFCTHSLLFKNTSAVVEGKLRLITDLCSLGPEDVKHVVIKCGAAFTQSEDKLTTSITTLLDHGFTGQQVAKILRSANLLFNLDLEGKVLPLLAELERLLGGDRDAAIAVATKGGALFGASAELLRFNFGWLVARGGLSEGQARALLQRAPTLFTYDFAGAIFQTKLAYWQALHGISLPELLEQFGIYLEHGLSKVDRMVYTMEQRGERKRLLEPQGSKGKATSLAWTSLSYARFEKRYGGPVVPDTDVGWRASQRVEQYGLLQSKVATKGYTKVGPKAWQQELAKETSEGILQP